MKLKYILSIAVSLILIIIIYNFIIPKTSPYIIDYNDDEISWIKDHVNKNVYYYLSGDMPEVIDEIIVTLECRCKLIL